METTAHVLPWYVPVTLWGSVLVGGLFWIMACKSKKNALIFILGYLGVVLATGINTPLSPWALGAFLLLLMLIAYFAFGYQKFFGDLEDEHLHYLHLWRLPFAFLLLWFYQHGISPLELTFEGLNYDIIIGLTAPVVASLAFSQKMLNREIVMGWNVLGLIGLGICVYFVFSEYNNSPGFAQLFRSAPYFLVVGMLLPLSVVAHVVTFSRLMKKEVALDA